MEANHHSSRAILVAEDDVALRDLIVGVLRADGHDVTEAESTDALSAMLRGKARGSDASAAPFDLVVTDNRMPNGHAIDAIAELRVQGIATPMILMTAFPDAIVRHKASALRVMVVPKPLSLQALRFAVDFALRALDDVEDSTEQYV